MSHRIDIELTSANDGVWTWRAAGARQPKGTLDTGMLYEGARVGDVVRAEAERELEGTRIVAIVAPKSRRFDGERLEVIGSTTGPTGPSVNVTYADKARGGRDGERRGPRPERPGGGDRPDRGARPDRPRRDGDRPTRPTAERPARGPRPDAVDRADRTDRPDRPIRTRTDRPVADTRAKPKRLTPGRKHRDALLADIAPEQHPVAEQLFRGGIPAVRQAIIDQNAQLKAEGKGEIPAGPLLAMADELLPRTRQADWLDRAAAALDVADDISIRDLRAVVTQSDGTARDDASRAMAANLREALQRRIESERTHWLKDITSSADEGKLVRAVRLTARMPDPAAKMPVELTERLVTETNAALSPDAPQDRWAALVEAAAEAPFRRDIVPAGLPTTTSESFLAAAAQASNRIPALLKLLGLAIPPPPRAKSALPLRPPAPPRLPVPAAPVPAAPVPAAPAPAAPAVAPIPADAAPAFDAVAPVETAAAVEPVAAEALPVEAPPLGPPTIDLVEPAAAAVLVDATTESVEA